MRTYWSLVKREIAAWLVSPIGFVVMAFYYLVTGLHLINALRASEGLYVGLEAVVANVMVRWLPLVVAVLTMRSFARLRAMGTLETLLSAPVSDSKVVWGKFTGCWLLVMLVAGGLLIPLGFLFCTRGGSLDLDPGALLGGALGIALVSAFWCALGLFFSLLTREQGVACVMTLVVLGLPMLMIDAIDLVPVIGDKVLLFHRVDVHLADMAAGLIGLSTVTLYAGGTLLLLFWSTRVLESLRWR